MIRTHQLIKLRCETVRDLKRLKLETGQIGLDELINSMIRITQSYRMRLKETGWNSKE
jgi:hypothetical protein